MGPWQEDQHTHTHTYTNTHKHTHSYLTPYQDPRRSKEALRYLMKRPSYGDILQNLQSSTEVHVMASAVLFPFARLPVFLTRGKQHQQQQQQQQHQQHQQHQHQHQHQQQALEGMSAILAAARHREVRLNAAILLQPYSPPTSALIALFLSLSLSLLSLSLCVCLSLTHTWLRWWRPTILR
jgi:hypothetical protein